MILTNIAQQSQLGFTATIYSREPELTFASGRPRFDMFQFDRGWTNNSTQTAIVSNEFVNALTANYPEFSSKYSIPQFVAAILSARKSFGQGADAVGNFSYIPSGGETANYNSRGLPLINETSVRLEAATDGTNQTAVLEVAAELIFLAAPDESTAPEYSLFDKLGVLGSTYETNRAKYSAKVTFSPPLTFGTNIVTNMPLMPTTNWFTNSKGWTDCMKIYDQNLTGCFAILRGGLTNTTTNLPASSATNLAWQLPQNIVATISYSGSNNVYQSVSTGISPAHAGQTNLITSTNSTRELVFHIVTLPQGGQGVRGDPRMGLHELTILRAPATTNNVPLALLPASNSNTNVSLGSLNNTWAPGAFDGDPLSPDITPPYTVFESDRGIRYYHPTYFSSSGMLGEIPITTFKSGHHLAWSTPRFWGDGRTNMGGIEYPPDWLMLDCVHTAMFPPDSGRVFTGASNGFLSFGRVNINGLKSFFQIQKGSATQADSIIDSAIIGVNTKDFRDYDTNNRPTNQGADWLTITASDTNRKFLLTYITNQIVNSNRIYLTPFEFTAEIAGNTNISGVTNWMSYTPGSTNVSDRRIESLVRGLQQRVTTHGNQFSIFSLGQALQVVNGKTNVVGEAYLQAVYERAPVHDATTGAITNSPTGAPPMRQLYLRELRY